MARLDPEVDFIPDFLLRGILIERTNDQRESLEQPYSMNDLAVKQEFRIASCARPGRACVETRRRRSQTRRGGPRRVRSCIANCRTVYYTEIAVGLMWLMDYRTERARISVPQLHDLLRFIVFLGMAPRQIHQHACEQPVCILCSPALQ